MADEKFITTVEQRLTAVDETQEAFDSAIKRQQDLAKAHEDVAKSTEKQNENYKDTEASLAGVGKMLDEEIAKVNVAGKAWEITVSRIKEYAKELLEVNQLQANSSVAAFLHSLESGYVDVIQRVREYREESREVMREARTEMSEYQKVFQLQKDSIKEQLELEKELIEARRLYNIALAGGDPQKKKEAEAKAREETDAAKEKAEGNRLGIVYSKATQDKERAEEFRKQEKELGDQLVEAEAGERSAKKSGGLEGAQKRKAALSQILSSLTAQKRLTGDVIGAPTREVEIDPFTGEAKTFIVNDGLLPEMKPPSEQIKDIEAKIAQEDDFITKEENRREIRGAQLDNLRKRKQQAQSSAIQFESASEKGFDEVESGKKRAVQRVGTRNEIRSLQLATEEMTAQNKQDTENRKTAKTIVNDIPDEPQSDTSKWVQAAQILARENASLKSLLDSILKDKEADTDDMNAFKKKLKDVDRRLVNP